MPVDDIGGEDVGCVGIRVAEEVGECHGGEGVVVAERAFIEFHHCRYRLGYGGVVMACVS